jgi:hypothetical protein
MEIMLACVDAGEILFLRDSNRPTITLDTRFWKLAQRDITDVV